MSGALDIGCRSATEAEEAWFEQWVDANYELCQDWRQARYIEGPGFDRSNLGLRPVPPPLAQLLDATIRSEKSDDIAQKWWRRLIEDFARLPPAMRSLAPERLSVVVSRRARRRHCPRRDAAGHSPDRHES
jgi:hypothetical protein